MLSFLDRLFYSTSGVVNKTMKVGAAVVSSRRAGSTSAFDEINKYFTISAMPIVSSTYWNEVHGFTATDVEDDREGLQTMRNLGRNMAFLIKAIKAAAQTDGLPTQERESFTSFHTEQYQTLPANLRVSIYAAPHHNCGYMPSGITCI